MAKRTFLNLSIFIVLTTMALGSRADLAVLQYHHVSDSTPHSTSTSVSLFEAQMQFIRETGLSVVPLQAGTSEALNGENTGNNRVAITFDDAYDSVYSSAAPMLAEYGFPYTIFVNTSAVGGSGYMTWEQLSTLTEQDGVTIANHSADHGHLARKPDESQNEWRKRVRNSLDDAQTQLSAKLGTDAPMFAYPYGEFDEALESMISDRGWYGYGQQSGPIGESSGKTRLPRFPMANAYGQLDSLENKLRSKALPVDAKTLPDGVINSNPPLLSLNLPADMTASRLTCFASGMGRIEFSETAEGPIQVQAPKAFNSRRFRYNCTYPAGNGRFYWLSQQWLDLSQPED